MSAPIRGFPGGDRFGASMGAEGAPPGKRVSARTAWREARALFQRHRGRLAAGFILMLVSRLAGLQMKSLVDPPDADPKKYGLDKPAATVKFGSGSSQATVVLGGSGGGLEEDERFDAIQDRLADVDPQVRYEALRAYVRRVVRTRG